MGIGLVGIVMIKLIVYTLFSTRAQKGGGEKTRFSEYWERVINDILRPWEINGFKGYE